MVNQRIDPRLRDPAKRFASDNSDNRKISTPRDSSVDFTINEDR